MATKKTAPKKAAAKPVAKKVISKKSAKPAPKPATKKPEVKKVNKPVAKPVAKAVSKKPAPKPASKVVASKAPAKKVAVKVVAKAPVKKVVAKAPVKKVVAKVADKKPVAKVVAKPVAKVIEKKKEVKPVVVSKKVAPKPDVKKEKLSSPKPISSKPVMNEEPKVKKEPKKAVKAGGKKTATKTIISSSMSNLPKRLDVFKTNTFGTANLKNDTGKVIAHRKTSELKRKTDLGDIKKYEPEHTRSILDMSPSKESTSYRYSDDDLQEFREIVSKKLETAKNELQYLQGVIMRKDEGGTEDTENKYQGIEDGSASMDREQFNQLASRQITFISHLEQALVRIENKTYGICRETGKLIDKARLRAVPHATLSIEAKNAKKN